jgi:hypothetical protein
MQKIVINAVTAFVIAVCQAPTYAGADGFLSQGAAPEYILTPVAPGQQFELAGLIVTAPAGNGWEEVQRSGRFGPEFIFSKMVAQHHTLLAAAAAYRLSPPIRLPGTVELQALGEIDARKRVSAFVHQRMVNEQVFIEDQVRFYSLGRYRQLSSDYPTFVRLGTVGCTSYKLQAEDTEAVPRPPVGERSVVVIEGYACVSPLGEHIFLIEISERKLDTQQSPGWEELHSFLSSLSFPAASR